MSWSPFLNQSTNSFCSIIHQCQLPGSAICRETPLLYPSICSGFWWSNTFRLIANSNAITNNCTPRCDCQLTLDFHLADMSPERLHTLAEGWTRGPGRGEVRNACVRTVSALVCQDSPFQTRWYHRWYRWYHLIPSPMVSMVLILDTKV